MIPIETRGEKRKRKDRERKKARRAEIKNRNITNMAKIKAPRTSMVLPVKPYKAEKPRSSTVKNEMSDTGVLVTGINETSDSDDLDMNVVMSKANDSDVSEVKAFPLTPAERQNFLDPEKQKKISPFQFRVYDLCSKVPVGYVSTYKILSDALGASPRAVGQALRNNPFAPLPVPCHRILASNFFIGGFSGQWGDGQLVCNKRAKLYKEGLRFDKDGYLLEEYRNTRIFKDF